MIPKPSQEVMQGMEHKQTQSDEKKAYEAPAILSREPLEAIAADCLGSGGKSNSGACPSGPINS